MVLLRITPDSAPAMREEVRGLRDTEAGRFVLRLYSEERVRAPRGA